MKDEKVLRLVLVGKKQSLRSRLRQFARAAGALRENMLVQVWQTVSDAIKVSVVFFKSIMNLQVYFIKIRVRNPPNKRNYDYDFHSIFIYTLQVLTVQYSTSSTPPTSPG